MMMMMMMMTSDIFIAHFHGCPYHTQCNLNHSNKFLKSNEEKKIEFTYTKNCDAKQCMKIDIIHI